MTTTFELLEDVWQHVLTSLHLSPQLPLPLEEWQLTMPPLSTLLAFVCVTQGVDFSVALSLCRQEDSDEVGCALQLWQLQHVWKSRGFG